VSGSDISWAICKSAPRSRLTTTPAPHHSVFYRPDALPAARPTVLRDEERTVYLPLFTRWHCPQSKRSRVHETVRRTSVYLSQHGTTRTNPLVQVCCCGPGGQEYRSIAAAAAGECGQCHFVSVRRQLNIGLLTRPGCAKAGLCSVCDCVFRIYLIFHDSVRPIILTSTGPIVTTFAGLVEIVAADERSEVSFYRAMLCYVMLSMGLCLPVSVSVSVTSQSSTKTAKRRITQTTPHDSPGTLVF